MQQGALLKYVLGVLGKYFIADGNGLSDAVVKVIAWEKSGKRSGKRSGDVVMMDVCTTRGILSLYIHN